MSRIVNALLLAAGFGTRLLPITAKIPKCMVSLAGKPLLAHWLEILLPNHVDRVVINTHYLPEVVRSFVAESPWAGRIQLVHEEVLLGTAGTIRENRAYLAQGPMFIAHADNASRFSMQDFVAAFHARPAGCIGTMMTFDSENPGSCGIVELDSRNRVIGYHEKVQEPPSNRANAAVFLFDPGVYDLMAQWPKVTDFCGEFVPHLLGKINTFHNKIYHRDIGTPDSYQRAVEDWGCDAEASGQPLAAHAARSSTRNGSF